MRAQIQIKGTREIHSIVFFIFSLLHFFFVYMWWAFVYVISVPTEFVNGILMLSEKCKTKPFSSFYIYIYLCSINTVISNAYHSVCSHFTLILLGAYMHIEIHKWVHLVNIWHSILGSETLLQSSFFFPFFVCCCFQFSEMDCI